MRHVDQLGHIARVVEDAGTIGGEILHHSEDLSFGPDVDASGQVIEQEDLRAGEQELSYDNLLLIAAGQRTDELLRVQAPDAEVLHGWADELLFYIPAQDSKAMQMFQAGQREVLAHRKSGKHALSLPVLRN